MITFSPLASPPVKTPARFGQAGKTLPDARFDALLNNSELVFLDLEMTGLSLYKDDIIEISALKFKNGAPVGKPYTTFVKPNKPVPARITRLTSITNAQAQAGEEPRKALQGLLDYIGKSPVIVGDHISTDIAFLQKALDRHGLSQYADRFENRHALCTQTLAQAAAAELSNTEADDLLATATHPQHRAENDVRNCASFFYKLVDILCGKQVPLETLRDVASYQGAILPFKG